MNASIHIIYPCRESINSKARYNKNGTSGGSHPKNYEKIKCGNWVSEATPREENTEHALVEGLKRHHIKGLYQN